MDEKEMRDMRREEISNFLNKVAAMSVAAFPEFLEANILMLVSGNQKDGVEIIVLSDEQDDWISRKVVVNLLCQAVRYIAGGAAEHEREEMMEIVTMGLNGAPR